MAVLKVRQNGQWVVVGTGEKGEKGDTGNIKDLDTELSETSTNAVQNKVVATQINSINQKITNLQNSRKYLHNIHIQNNSTDLSMSICFSLITSDANAYDSSGIISILDSQGYRTSERICSASGVYYTSSFLGIVSGIYKNPANNTSITINYISTSGNQAGKNMTLSNYSVYDFVVEI